MEFILKREERVVYNNTVEYTIETNTIEEAKKELEQEEVDGDGEVKESFYGDTIISILPEHSEEEIYFKKVLDLSDIMYFATKFARDIMQEASGNIMEIQNGIEVIQPIYEDEFNKWYYYFFNNLKF